ncbi:DUF2326 domain-containing protein [Paraclostridium sordellii]|uniref:DUF2326 domain-containing protein n=1 Tax=Paraclostridium sordellii TaxID=1505 RepID=UPI0005E67950|nr:DUF2326 domain-containing protein [Paeniclostridium sordellii]CEP81959.1 Uncharacterized protein conserved in bacteria (DUF2326) [[Clostridium] sordellii] [Paeniclostridium sordellii]
MKLIKLYSSDSRFKTVEFGERFNLVLGIISDESQLTKDSHNLGKSSLIELIDFMLLKSLKKESYLNLQEFKEHIFFLEVEINEDKYITIKRSIKNNTKISFKISKNKNNDFTNNHEWDYKDLPLNSKDKTKNPKNILQDQLDFNVLEEFNYRKYISYFLRGQTDYSDPFHLSKFSGGDAQWKPLLFELLGFNSKDIEEKYSIDKDIEKKKENIKLLKEKLQVDIKDIDKLKGLIQIKELEKKRIEESLKKFDFYMNEKNIDKDLVYKIEEDISNLNGKRYKLEMEIKSLQNSIEKDVTFDLKSTMRIFNEVNLYFPDQLKKSYEDLLEFNKALTTDRNKYIESTLNDKIEELKETQEVLSSLNIEREKMLGVLTETDPFKKYRIFDEQLIKVKSELDQYNSKIEQYFIVEEEIETLNHLKLRLDEVKKKIRYQVDSGNSLYANIRQTFSNLVEQIIGKPGLLSLTENKSGNIEFKAEIYNSDNILTAEGEGHSYKKILCACFDLALLVNYSDRRFIKFIYHDGCLETLDPRKQKNYLDLIQKLCNDYNIQYILTSIDSDIPKLDGELYVFEEDFNIAVKLSDEDNTTNLFGFEF